ncbi:Hsp20/alpha crystallin family protein [Rhizobium binae]|uniref:Hsp20/alpha crystallin family protein n=1 Tax=Rhizobium binae TaxID=1138190 RepID=UPI001C82A8BD|nr:Hsp20/alpha crystallin family protein [Rhizobium binae]MBX4927870.1 Hsp20/alpha crystallin family protein [Rhizobium binae]MBX4968372.1 Hsp20/alpha crystallin family protein [Rhizobium binae]
MADTGTKPPAKTEEKSAAPFERWRPFENLRSEIDRVFNDFSPTFFDRTFSRMPAAFSRSLLAVDIVESAENFDISAELPGVDAKDLDVTLTDGILTIKGEKNEAKEENEKDYYLSERRYGSFRRSLELPRNIDSEKIDANFSNGVLKIRLPKTSGRQDKDHKIVIKTA